MYGGSGKLGRGRGGGPVKRNIHTTFQPSSVQRPSTTPGGGRLSAGGGHRNRSNTPVAPALVSTAEETFSLVRNNPLNFGMIIRLSPVLVEEIKRLEAQGGAARMKFDSSAKNPAGNIIDVGGKEFRFTWSQETGDLCDIYEECESGDNGNGLLVESGGAWRKLNVQRELDESFKNHVKMRTVEAERKHKSRTAIVLDHPSTKNHMKAVAAAEVNNTWRGSYKQKKEPPFKKMKADTYSGPPKSVGKARLSSSTPSKVRTSASPLLSTPEQSGAPLSPHRNSNALKVHANRDDATLNQSSKENAGTSEKEMLNRGSVGAIQNKPGSNEKFGNKPTDLPSLLISLLMEKPQGMNLKALEKAVGDTIPKSVKQIEPILKKVAVLQGSGRYILKPDVDLESFKKYSSGSGSSPENNHHHREVTAPESSFPSKANDVKESEEPSHLISAPYEELNLSEKIDIEHRSPDVLSEKKVSENSEGPAASSSLSGSDSDSESDSSDSGSDSGSPNRSPAGSGSGSSGDSESDASSNSKEGSDEDVDIMSDDDKEPKQILLHPDPGLSTPRVPSTAPEVGYARNLVDEKDEENGSDFVELERDLFADNQEADMHVTTNSFPDKDGDNYADESRNLFVNHIEHQDRNLHSDKENVAKDGSEEIERVVPRTKAKRGFDENEHAKRLKTGNWARPAIPRGRNSFSESPLSRSPDGPNEVPYRGPMVQMDRTVRDVTDYDYEKVDNREVPGNSTSDSPRSGPRAIDLNARAKAPASMERTERYVEGLDLDRYSERGPQGHEPFFPQKDKTNKEIRDEDGHSKDRRPPKNSRLGADGGKHSGSHQKKHDALIGKIKEAGLVSTSQPKDSPIDNYRTDMKKSPVVNGRGATLRREASALEMGEFREDLLEETSGAKKRFERNSSFKQSENKPSSDHRNLDASKGNLAGRTSLDSAKASPLQSGIGTSSIPPSLSKKLISEDHNDDFARINGKPIQRETQALSRVDHVKPGSQQNKFAETNSKGRHNEAGAGQGIGSEGYSDSQRKVPPVGAAQKYEKQGAPPTTRDNRRQKSNDLGEKRKDFWLVDSRDSGQKRREMESSSDDSITSYTKYEKEEPEMKGPINDLSQYNEYVQEYREKYDCYHTLNKILQSYRTEFQIFGRDLELAKGRDNVRYNNILEQLMESYRQCATKHKRLKKIFVVLHHELQHLKEMIRDFAEKQTKG
ncbi:dentin sialophosphoprotein isoform X1 [Cynara cardunculus var. scolymus]|uniref:dentin sialophosphoprotein isoform X1 n=2 Tax=Cynara cardunculus var. scolymus TaxID=59895 RepID=UPI000D62E5D6|nr:dentin sialophosphoprotein isoform X1 [Cynara cardunculus var. scolymus]